MIDLKINGTDIARKTSSYNANNTIIVEPRFENILGKSSDCKEL